MNNRWKSVATIVAAGIVAVGFTTGAAVPSTSVVASAGEVEQLPTSGWGIPQPNGTVLPLSESTDLPDRPGKGEVSPQLIGPIEHYNCWTLGWEGLNFGNHFYPWNGELQTISLLCGTDGYGYRHISNGHATDWTNVMIAANDDSGDSWDDLMSFSITAAMTDGSIVGPGAANKKCATSRVYWYPNGYDQPSTYSHKVIAIWSWNNKTVINAYPIRDSVHCDLDKL